MKPVAIFQHDPTQRAGFLLDFLGLRGIPSRVFRSTEREGVPVRATDFSGLVFLGGRLSVYDAMPWIQQEVSLIRHAIASDIPVLGHGLGGQLMARSLGARVSRNAWPNIGWCPLRVTPGAKTLFDGAPKVMSFNWHDETFAIPRGATRTLFGTHCLNEGFSIGKYLAFQCHLESQSRPQPHKGFAEITTRTDLASTWHTWRHCSAP